MFYTALYDYTGESAAGTLCLTAGEALVVTTAETGGWLTGYRTAEPGTVGTFPASYAEPATREATPPAAEAAKEAGQAAEGTQPTEAGARFTALYEYVVHSAVPEQS